MLDFTFTEEQQKVIDLCKELAKDFRTRAAEHDRDRTAPDENYEILKEKGLYGISIPKEYGGFGIGFQGYAAAAVELAKGCASTANSFNMHANACGTILSQPLVSESAKKMVADLAINQGKLFSVSTSEPASSSLIITSFIPSVQAVKVDGGYRIYGKKAFCSMIESSDYVFLYAHPEEDPNPEAAVGLLVPVDKGNAEGVTIHDVWDTHGMRATRSNTVEYDGTFVPDELALYKTEDFLNDFIMRSANWTIASFASVYLGIGMGILEYTTELLTAKNAKGFSQPQAFHPDSRRRVGEMAAELHAAYWSNMYAAWYSDTHGPTLEAFHNFMRAKHMIASAVSNASRSAQIACGAHGMFKNLHLERMVRDAATAPIMPPTIDACADQVGLLTMGLNPADTAPPLKAEEPKKEKVTQ
ncbi:acyl-CoA dehydrogenase family protein [Siminovitchia sediminis]|uniref:Acyl-CoA dehydrogenase family protein n=1 Tax=Siminovitchia sediminis TaxID=1274353 RepID=A0ABW4KFW3_9BACI